MDIVYLRRLEVETLVGVYTWERQAKRSLFLDIELGTDFSRAANADDLSGTIDYAQIAQELSDLLASANFQLIEAVAEACAEHILRDERVQWLRLRVAKPGAVPEAEEVGVVIERQNTSS